jgi:hypothetical protein
VPVEKLRGRVRAQGLRAGRRGVQNGGRRQVEVVEQFVDAWENDVRIRCACDLGRAVDCRADDQLTAVRAAQARRERNHPIRCVGTVDRNQQPFEHSITAAR